LNARNERIILPSHGASSSHLLFLENSGAEEQLKMVLNKSQSAVQPDTCSEVLLSFAKLSIADLCVNQLIPLICHCIHLLHRYLKQSPFTAQ
jgi:hypothetical protein